MNSSVQLADIHPDLVPHPTQRQVLEDPAKFKVVVTGRRWGKSQLALIAAVDHIIGSLHPATVWIVTPSFEDLQQIWDRCIRLLREARHDNFRRAGNVEGKLVTYEDDSCFGKCLVFFNGDRLYFKTAEVQSALKEDYGSPSFLVVDDAAYLPCLAWQMLMVWALDEVEGALFLSSPVGGRDESNVFYQLYLAGSEIDREVCFKCTADFQIHRERCFYWTPICKNGIIEYESRKPKQNYKTFVFSSYDNPFVSKDQLDELVKIIPNPLRDVFGYFV
jgi:hypothetical protein